MSAPVVSVVMATYNHAAYVAEAIYSVLQQQGVEFEFLIADDASRDATAQVVAGIRDPRIRFMAHTHNRGACAVTNELIEQASGEFVAIINSDDRWLGTDKLASQLEIMRADPSLGACFGRARFIDAQGAPIDRQRLAFAEVFDQPNRSQGEWLRYFFERGNCLCHPSVLIRRRCYEQLGGYNNNLRQLPDFDMWVRLLKHYPIHVMARELLDFRVLPHGNASSHTANNSIRIMNEHFLIAEGFFQGISGELLQQGFADQLHNPLLPSQAHLDIEATLLLLQPHKALGRAHGLVALLQLNALLASPAHQGILLAEYGIDGRWFQARSAEIDTLRPRLVARLGQAKHRLQRWLRQCAIRFGRRQG